MTSFDSLPAVSRISSDLPAALIDQGQTALEQLQQTPVPTRKTESWKYSARRLKGIETLAPVQAASTRPEPEYALDCYTIAVSNGLVGELPDIPGLTLKRFDELSDDEAKRVTDGMGASAQDLPFAALNSASLQNGLFIQLEKQQVLDKPLRLLVSHSGSGVSFPRLFVQLCDQAQMTLIEELHVDDPAHQAWVNALSDMDVAAGASLTYLRMNIDDGQQWHMGATSARLHRDARFHSHCLTLGSQLGRHDLRVEMVEPGAECTLNGVCVTREKQHFDNHTSIEHCAPHCTSDESYRCIADDQSQIIFNGRIHIHPHAQKTLGEMSNKNLLLSSSAEINAKPELEIYADDVKCAHGTTIGQLNPTEMYYLKTRGIPEDQAKQMLTLGFVLERVQAVPLEAIADYWEQKLINILQTDLA